MMRLYLTSEVSQQAGRPADTATADADQGHAGLARLVCLGMSAQKGAAAAQVAASCVAHPAGGMDLFRIFLSPALADQTLATGEHLTFAGGFEPGAISAPTMYSFGDAPSDNDEAVWGGGIGPGHWYSYPGYMATVTQGDYFELAFTGDSILLTATEHGDAPVCAVLLDGAAQTAWDQTDLTYELTGLTYGPHVIRVTCPAGSWSLEIESASFDPYLGADARLRVYAYLWRPGVGKVCSLSGDASGITGYTDPAPVQSAPFPAQWQAFDLPALAADIVVRLRDRIVVEVWQYREIAVTTTAYFYFNGSNDAYADGDPLGAGGAASYLAYSSNLLLGEDIAMNAVNILVGARDIEVDSVNVGALDGGVDVEYTPQHIEHTVDQRMGIQRVDRISERMVVKANLLEPTLENLRIAWGQPTTSLSTSGTLSRLMVGSAGSEMVEHSLVLKGKAPGTSRSRTITCWKAVAIEASAHSYKRDGRTVIPVTFLLVEDNTKSAGEKYMDIDDDTGAYTFAA